MALPTALRLAGRGGYKYLAPPERNSQSMVVLFFFDPLLFSDQVIAYSDALRS